MFGNNISRKKQLTTIC